MSAGDADRGKAGSDAGREDSGHDLGPGFEHDAERDAWLSQALRHAPDAGMSAPAAVRLNILREARSAAGIPLATPTPRQPAPWWRRIASGGAALWALLARPPVAAGFASVMVATLVGLLWWDRPMDEALPRPPLRNEAPSMREQRPLAPAGVPESAPVPAREPATAVPSPTKDRRRDAMDAGARRSAPAASKLGSDAADREDRPSPTQLRIDPSAALSNATIPTPAARPLPVPSTAPAPPPAATPMQDMPAARAAPPAPEAPTAPRTGAAAPVAEAARPGGGADLSSRSAVPASAPLADNFLSSGKAPLANGLVPNRPMAELLLSMLEQPHRWTSQSSTGDGTPQPMTNALIRWLLRLDDIAAGLKAAPVRPAPAATDDEPVPLPTVVVRLLRDGQPAATVELGADHITIDITPTVTRSAGSPERHTALPTAGMNALKASLATATR